MDFNQTIVLSVFIAVFAAIIAERIDKTIVVLLAAIGLIATRFIDFETAIHSIDFSTICLLLGMMLIVECLRQVRLFDWLAIKLALITRGNPAKIFLLGGIATAVLSAFLDNVTTVLVLAPLIISLAQGMGLPPKVFIFCVIFLSNIGGTATLIGDPPNILIGSQVPELTFTSFLEFLAPPAILSAAAALLYLAWRNKATIRSRSGHFQWFFISNLLLQDIRRKELEIQIPRRVIIRSGAVFFLVLLGFFTHSATHLEPPVVALSGASLLLLTFHKEIDLHRLVSHIEWPTLLFFSGLFVVVGAMEHTGILELFSVKLISMTSNLLLLILVVLWASAIMSAVVDNIPFVAVMIPLIKDLIASPQYSGQPNLHLLWWALALGACLGGNGSMIGASANVVTCAIARSKGISISFREFAVTALPTTLITIVISSLYLVLLYYF